MGVAQGSSVSNILFSLLLNDLPEAVPEAEILMYADDVAAVVSAPSIDALENKLNAVAARLAVWFRINGLALNLSKTHYIHFRFSGAPIRELSVAIDGRAVDQVECTGFLGFQIDRGLMWAKHIDVLCGRLGSACYALSRVSRVVSADVARACYFATVHSQLQYGAELWARAADWERAFRMQKRAIRAMVRIRSDVSARPHFKSLGILTLPCIAISQVALYVRNNLDSYATHGDFAYRTRNQHKLVSLARSLTKSSRLTHIMGPQVYNRLPDLIKEAANNDGGACGVTTDGLLSALARLRRPPAPLPHPSAHPSRSADGRHQSPKIQSARPPPEYVAGADGSMTVARGDGSPERLGGALRRLHYKATRRAHSASARHANAAPPPKAVVVMGSSTTSDKTINTSTDSAATALTSITGTDDSMDTEPEPPEPTLIDEPPPPPNQNGTAEHNKNPPSTAPPHYHRNENSCDINSPAYTKPQSATDVLESPRPGPARFIFDVPLPDPKKFRNKTQVSIGGPSTSIQIPPKLETPKSPKAQAKLETHFDFEPEAKRRGSEEPKRRASESRAKSKKEGNKEYYKDEMSKLRRQLEGTEVFTTNRRRSSAHQHSVPPPSARRQSTAAQVHVTANPLDSASTTIPAGRTTIVVQQPSLSLDYGGCATLLLQDGLDRRKSRLCADHIQQLLDVTSQFTEEDLHEFDKRYGSPHHSRSQSVKTGRSRASSQLLGLPQQRARVASMPNTGVEEEYYRLRHFSITGKGVVNRGDSLRSRRSRSNTSVASSASSNEAGTRASAPCSLASSRDSSAGLSSYRVLVLGAPGVGKSSLVGQFMTSEYLHAYDTSIDDESGERSVCVLLAGEESEITFLDAPPDHVVVSTDGCAHGYCVVYSTAERSSFADAEKRLQALWAAGHTARRAVILVGNKADLARSRIVTTDEGKALATSYECKFIETSVGINHNVDELLVGLLTQIRLKQQHAVARAERQRKRNGSRKTRNRARSPKEIEEPAPPASAASTPRKRTRLSASVKVRGLLGRVWARDSKSKSCENLHVL